LVHSQPSKIAEVGRILLHCPLKIHTCFLALRLAAFREQKRQVGKVGGVSGVYLHRSPQHLERLQGPNTTYPFLVEKKRAEAAERIGIIGMCVNSLAVQLLSSALVSHSVLGSCQAEEAEEVEGVCLMAPPKELARPFYISTLRLNELSISSKRTGTSATDKI
jgi:hypothetical protein